MALTRSSSTSTTSHRALPAQEQQHQDLDLGALAMVAGQTWNPMAALALQTLGGNDLLQSMLGLGQKEPPRSPDQTTDPNERLTLWEAEQRALAKATVKDDALNDPQRKATAASTLDELDEEVGLLRDQQMDGQPLTLDQVDALIARKAQEGAIESAHGVNLTHAPRSWLDGLLGGEAAGADRAYWSAEDLADLEGDLSQLSDGLLPANGITELRRVSTIEDAPGSKGARDGQAVQITDAAKGGGIGATAIQQVGEAIFQNQGLGPSEQAGTFAQQLLMSVNEPGGHLDGLIHDPESAVQAAEEAYGAAREKFANPSATDTANMDQLEAEVEEAKKAVYEARAQRDAKAQQAQVLESSLTPE